MAESSSTSASTSTAANSDYDVFVNHRGPDVKKKFASHLYRRLISHGLRVFLDQPELKQGDSLTPQIESAIRSASVHVAIFSSRYAGSAWCLKELVLMRESNSPIIPVFYHAEPSDLLAIKGRYARALEALKMKKTASDPQTGEVNLRYDPNTIENWRTALSSVKEIVGFDLKACHSDEGELVDKVVEGVLRKLKKPALDVATYPTGLDDKINDFENTVLLPLQQSGKPQILGIWGLGGVGKTTLAKEFFNRKKSDYSRSCFLFDVRDYAGKGTLKLVQGKLLKCLTGSDHPIDSDAEGTARLKTHLSSAKALVIIDDVDHEDQVDALLPRQSVLHSNSLILITSRYKNVLTGRDKNTSIYKLEGLNPPQAEELFCCYAFNQTYPLLGFESLVKKFLKTCDGLPLSLKVFGARLNGNYDKCRWQYLLNELELPSEIQTKLKIIYDSLNGREQQIFLDIACFFIGENRDMAIKIWEGSGWNGLLEFQNIQDKCLVEVDSKNKIKMHDHLRDLGRDLAKAPALPRRLWSWKENDIDDLWQQSGDVITVRGIKLVSSEYNGIDVEDALSGIRMRSLQLLDGEGVLVEHILAKVLSPNLRWLRWKNCPCSSLPSSISMKNLRVLHLEDKRLGTLWQNESQAPLELRELEIMSNRSNSLNSVWKFPKSIGKLKHLERIVIRPLNNRETSLPLIKLSEEFCLVRSLKVLISRSPMESLPECFGNLTNLHHIELSKCYSFESLPESFSNLTNLHHIELSECYSLESLPESFGNLTNLHRIELSGCNRLESLPESFGNLINLHRIKLSGCSSLESLPESFGDLTNLHHIQLSGCLALERLPDSFVKLINLKHLNLSSPVAHQGSDGQLRSGDGASLKELQSFGLLRLGYTYLKELPSAIGELSDLEVLMVQCLLLDTLPPSLCDLKNLKLLTIEGCKELKCLPASLGDLRNLKELTIWGCNGLKCLPPSLGLLTQLTELTVGNCPLIRELPFTGERDSSIHNCILPGLRRLYVDGTGISEVSFAEGVCCNLRSLHIDSCNNVVEVGTLPNTLTDLSIGSCHNLRKIDKIHGLAKLQRLSISACRELEELPLIETLVSLSSLDVSGCVKLKELPRIETLVSLSSLDVSGCVKLKSIRGLGQLTNLQKLSVRKCSELEEVDGIQDCTLLQSIHTFGCPKLQRSAEVVEQLKQRCQLYL